MTMWYFCENQNETLITDDESKSKMAYDGGHWTSLSRAETREELIANSGILERPCSCGKLISTCYCEPIKSQLIEHNRCFTCNFWEDRIRLHQNNPKSIIVEHHAFVAEESPKHGNLQCLGFGGALFRFVRLGETKVEECRNMWSQGPIPERYWDRLPDNASFLR